MTSAPEGELQRLNAEIVGYLLNQRSPPRELLARREDLRAREAVETTQPMRESRRTRFWSR